MLFYVVITIGIAQKKNQTVSFHRSTFVQTDLWIHGDLQLPNGKYSTIFPLGNPCGTIYVAHNTQTLLRDHESCRWGTSDDRS